MKKLFLYISLALISLASYAQTGDRPSVKRVRFIPVFGTDTTNLTDGTVFYNGTSNKFRFRQNGTTISLGSGTGVGVTDGDKGDVTVTSSGTVWTIDNNVVTTAKMSTFSSSDLAGKLTDESGTGVVAYTTSPTFTTPALGTPSSGDASNMTGNVEAYDATGWNGDNGIPTKNDIRDKIETLSGTTGAQDLFITGPAMWPKATSGCSLPNPFEVGGTATVMALDFDQSTDENAQFQMSLPRNWNNGTVTVTVYWTATSGSGTVQFEVSAVAFSNDDPLSGSFGTAVAIDDTLIATSDVHVSPTSSAITIGGTPADADFLLFNIMRDVSDDTLSADARLLGIRVTLTLDAATSE